MLFGDAFAQNNAFPEAFPAAVRVGINASMVLAQLSMLIRLQMPANGYLVEAGGGYETVGTSIAVNEMLLQSHEGYLRLFPVFPPGQPASFTQLRAVDAFVVSAALGADGTVDGIEVLSEAGRNCTIFAPQGMAVTTEAGKEVPVRSVQIGAVTTGLWQFDTAKGGRYSVSGTRFKSDDDCQHEMADITKSGACPIEQQGMHTALKMDDELLQVSVALGSGPTHNLSRLTLGCHLDLGYSLQERAFSSNMIFGESFEGNLINYNNQDNQSFVPPIGLNTTWPLSLVETVGTATLDGAPFHGMRSLRVVHSGSGAGVVGRRNRGVRNNGFLFEAGHEYEGFVFVAWRSGTRGGAATPVVQLRDYNRGEIIASAELTMPAARVTSSEFQRWNFTLTPNASTTCTGSSLKKIWLCSGEIVVGLRGPSEDNGHNITTVDMDYVVVQPGAWARLADKSGRPLPTLRRTVEALQSIGTSLVRIGGSFAESEWWFWKEWRGAPEQRESVGSIWGSALISGWGPFEAIDMSMAAGFEPVLATFADSIRHTSCCSPQDMADLVEYCWGNESTQWGRLRASDGHPEPYRLRYFELGCVHSRFVPMRPLVALTLRCSCHSNEQINSRFVEQVKAMEERARAVGVGEKLSYIWPSHYAFNFSFLNTSNGLLAEELGLKDRILNDIHTGVGDDMVGKALWQFRRRPQLTFGVVNLETNLAAHDVQRAVSEAQDLNELFNSFVPSTGADPYQNRIKARAASFCTGDYFSRPGWEQQITSFVGLTDRLWLQPPAHVHSILSKSWLPLALHVNVNDSTAGLRATRRVSAQQSSDGLRMRVIVTNTVAMRLQLHVQAEANWRPTSCNVTVLGSADGSADNSLEEPDAVVPEEMVLPCPRGELKIKLAPNSVTLIEQSSLKTDDATSVAMVHRLRLNQLEAPLNFPPNVMPTFGWALLAPHRGAEQVGYTLSARRVDKPGPNVSVSVQSGASINVILSELKLGEDQDWVWSVTLQLADGFNTSVAAARFSTGILDWRNATWIRRGINDRLAGAATDLFRAKLRIPFAPVRCRLFVVTPGFVQIQMNGKPVSSAVLGHKTMSRQRVLFDAHECQATSGDNFVGLVLSGGWARQLKQSNRTVMAVVCVRGAKPSQSIRLTTAADGTWQTAAGPIVATDMYQGEVYDGRLAAVREGWSVWQDKLGGWSSAQAERVPPAGRLVPSLAPPVRRVSSFPARVISQPRVGVFVVDFAQNLAGWVRLRIAGNSARGKNVTLTFSEELSVDGTVALLYNNVGPAIYTLLGDGRDETYEPSTTYWGFQYVQLEGLPTALQPSDIVSLFVHTDLSPVGNAVFGGGQASNVLNRVLAATQASQLSNWNDIHTDCPTR